MPRFLTLPTVAARPFAPPLPYAAQPTVRRLTVAALLGFEQIGVAAAGPAARRADGTTLVLDHAEWPGPDRLWAGTDAARLRALRQPGAVAAVALWGGAALQLLALGPAAPLAAALAERRPGWAWLGVSLETLLRDLHFRAVCPPDRTQGEVARDVSLYKSGLVNQPADVLTLEQAQRLRG